MDLTEYLRWKLQVLDHDNFRSRLKHQSKKYGCKIVEVDEYMTTKTCCLCGRVKNLGKDRVYSCLNDRCRLYTKRDINAACNIMQKVNSTM